jgi:hypothetical protein
MWRCVIVLNRYLHESKNLICSSNLGLNNNWRTHWIPGQARYEKFRFVLLLVIVWLLVSCLVPRRLSENSGRSEGEAGSTRFFDQFEANSGSI